jgi:hypothetical protein
MWANCVLGCAVTGCVAAGCAVTGCVAAGCAVAGCVAAGCAVAPLCCDRPGGNVTGTREVVVLF